MMSVASQAWHQVLMDLTLKLSTFRATRSGKGRDPLSKITFCSKAVVEERASMGHEAEPRTKCLLLDQQWKTRAMSEN